MYGLMVYGLVYGLMISIQVNHAWLYTQYTHSFQDVEGIHNLYHSESDNT